MPPNQVLVGLSLLLTFFVMAPVIKDVNKNAVQPYMKNQISQAQAMDRAAQPIRGFMFKQTREKDIATLLLDFERSRARINSRTFRRTC